jgi:leucine-zipper of insertion element IS481
MKRHRNAKTTPTSRAPLVQRMRFEGWTCVATATGAGVSVRTVRRWAGGFGPKVGGRRL